MTYTTTLLAGNVYVNVHTAQYPGGETRDQLTEVCATPTSTSTTTPTNTPTSTATRTPTATATSAAGRMTGGGTVSNSIIKVHHGFELNCDPSRLPQNLEINWGNGNKFHLDTLTSVYCYDDPAIDPGKPAASFDTLRGSGIGSYNSVPGATAVWLFSDAGEPGVRDFVRYLIKDVNNNIVLTISGYLVNGNQDAMRVIGLQGLEQPIGK